MIFDKIAHINENKYTDTENVPFAELDNIIKDLDQLIIIIIIFI